jgi:hypothetical protein
MIRRIGAMAAAGALAFAGVAWAATAGTYAGRTSQHNGSISLKVSGGKVVHVTFVAGNGRGSGCGSAAAAQPQFPVSFKSHLKIARNGTFSGTASPRDQEVFKISGHVGAKRVTGSFTDRIPLGQLTSAPHSCSSGKVTFTATRTR